MNKCIELRKIVTMSETINPELLDAKMRECLELIKDGSPNALRSRKRIALMVYAQLQFVKQKEQFDMDTYIGGKYDVDIYVPEDEKKFIVIVFFNKTSPSDGSYRWVRLARPEMIQSLKQNGIDIDLTGATVLTI